MSTPFISKFMLLLVLSSAFIVTTQAQSRKLRLQDLPPAVQAIVREQSKSSRVNALTREIENSQTFYNCEFMVNGHERTLRVAADGKIAEVEEEISWQDLPVPVKKTVRSQSQSARILGFNKENKDGTTLYELELKISDHQRVRHKDVAISADGAIVSVEKEVTIDSLPAPARTTIQQKAGRNKVELIEEVTKGSALAYYEVLIKMSADFLKIKVNQHGELVN